MENRPDVPFFERNSMSVQQFERTDRIASEMMREVEKIIREEVRYAKIYVSVLEEDKRQPMMKALKSAAGFIRHAVGQRIQMRYTPELIFYLDTSIEYGVHIAEILNQVNKETKDVNREQ